MQRLTPPGLPGVGSGPVTPGDSFEPGKAAGGLEGEHEELKVICQRESTSRRELEQDSPAKRSALRHDEDETGKGEARVCLAMMFWERVCSMAVASHFSVSRTARDDRRPHVTGT